MVRMEYFTMCMGFCVFAKERNPLDPTVGGLGGLHGVGLPTALRASALRHEHRQLPVRNAAPPCPKRARGRVDASLVHQKPTTSYDNVLRDIDTRYVEGYTAPTFADRCENAPLTEWSDEGRSMRDGESE